MGAEPHAEQDPSPAPDKALLAGGFGSSWEEREPRGIGTGIVTLPWFPGKLFNPSAPSGHEEESPPCDTQGFGCQAV